MTKSLHRYYKSQGNEHPKRWVFRRLQKTDRDSVDVTWRCRALQVQAVVIGCFLLLKNLMWTYQRLLYLYLSDQS